MTLAPLANRAGLRRDIVASTQTTGYASRSGRIYIEHDEGQFVATIDEIPLFGEGDSPRDAALDLVRSLVGLRAQLNSRRSRLSAELADQLAILDRLVG